MNCGNQNSIVRLSNAFIRSQMYCNKRAQRTMMQMMSECCETHALAARGWIG
jgi:hypothetical protein